MRTRPLSFVLGVLLIGAPVLARFAWAEDPPHYLTQWGSQGTGNGQFSNYPYGIATDAAGNVYVVDSGNSRIQKFTSNGTYLTQWGSYGAGNGQFSSAYGGIATDAAGNVYVVDQNRIQKFTSTGTYLTQWGSFGLPVFVATDAAGNVYVGNYNLGRVEKYSSTGAFLALWPLHLTGDEHFSRPMGVATDAAGGVYVADYYNSRIQKFTSNGTYLTQWGSYGTGNGQFSTPYGIATDAAGNVYVVDQNRIQKFTSTGTYLTQWGSFGTGNGQFYGPTGIATDAAGNVYVVDSVNNRIQKFGRRRPIVLVNGYCGATSDWNTLKQSLDASGYQTLTFDFQPNNDRPSVLAAQLASQLDSHFPNQEVDVIAHSMGGLVTRQYIRQRGAQSRIANLITLGTPHHGVDLMSLAFRVKSVSQLLKKTGWICQLNGNGAGDLLPGSAFLNNLNYLSPNVGDKLMKSSKGAHPSEFNYDPTHLKMWAFAGTRPFGGPAYSLTFPAWGPSYLNDGVVGVDAAVMWNNLGHDYVDSHLSLSPLQHDHHPYFYLGDRYYQNAQDLFPILKNILQGVPPAVSAVELADPLAARAQAEGDTTATVLLSENGQVAVGQTVTRLVVVPATSFLQVSLVADSTLLELRTPDATFLTPADTSTTPGLHYASDPTTGVAVFSVDNPAPGTWAAVLMAGSAVTEQAYAVGATILTTTEVVLEPASSLVYTGAVHLRASLQEAGVAHPGTNWNVTVLRPDSSAFNVTLYDDGAHGDSLSGDGIFATDVPLTPQVGLYLVSARALSLPDSTTYVDVATVELARYEDLAALSEEVTLSKNLVQAGDSVQVQGVVHNYGSDAVLGAKVEVWDDSTATLIDSVRVDLPAGGAASIQLPWHVTPPDRHLIRVTVDPFALPLEANYENNSGLLEVTLGQPLGVSSDQQAPRLILAPAMPNPWIGQTVLRFSLPQDDHATLGIYDILGRRLKRWSWPKLSAGQHQVSWDGKTDNGRPIAPGVLLYRLETTGQILKQKMIHLQ